MADTPTGDADGGAVAVVGLAGRFPGAPDVDAFWRNLEAGVESIERFSDDELRAAGIPPELIANPAYVKANGVCAEADLFDARYFGLSPREAQAMDPQQRVFLEGAVAALEHAGLDPDTFPGPIGVYAGVGVSTYQRLIEAHPAFVDLVGGLQVLIGTNKDHLTTHVSYRLDLRGPSVGVQTACSTSLVAIVHACQALLTYQCDAALAGGVSIAVPQREGYLYEVGGIESPDGHCRAFDLNAAGTVGGNGMGIVVLKRLADARADGDAVYAIVRGFAVNNDGANKVGYTAPSVEGQAEVIALAQGMAGVHPDTISYVEAHGTGTALGDPIEIAALTSAFRRHTDRRRFCAIGSVKTNIGHLDCAAGVAGVIKTILALRHRQLPPSLHFTAPNARIDFDETPFEVNTRLRAWDAPWPRRAGVSSFGIGGTNAHVVLEEAPVAEPSGPSRPVQLLVLSARSAEALQRAVDRLASHLDEHPAPLADVAFTLQAGRRALEYRTAITARTLDDARQALRQARESCTALVPVRRKDVPVAFVFPGQGSQQPGMARALYEDEPVFRAAFDECADRLTPLIGRDIRALCLGEATAEAADALAETWLAQPALFSVQYATARLWLSWGITPAALIGHSVGEYTAACLAGVFTLDGVLTVIAARGRLMQQAPRGAMLAVPLAAHALEPWPGDVDLAAVNAPALVTVAGSEAAIDAFADRLRQRGVESTRLRTSHAFHSRSLDSVLDAFRAAVASVPRHAPALRYASNVTGTWITPDRACDPDYYVQQLRHTVRFSEGVQTLITAGIGAFLEVGPGHVLTSSVRAHLPQGAAPIAVATSGGRGPATLESALASLGRLWAHGVRVDWSAFRAGERRAKVALPSYPFERIRHWVDEPVPGADDADADAPEGVEDAATRCYLPSWSRGRRLATGPAAEATSAAETWLLLADRQGLAARVANLLGDTPARVIVAECGERFERLDDTRFRIRADDASDFARMFDALRSEERWPDRVLHAWSLDAALASDGVWEAQRLGAFSVLAVSQALLRAGGPAPVTMLVVTTSTLRVLDDDGVDPARATLLGPCRTVPQEAPDVTCRLVDVRVPADGRWSDAVVHAIVDEAADRVGETTVAFRGGYRWVQAYEDVDVTPERAPGIRLGGTYLVTGGLGRLGLRIARWIAACAQVHLVLTSRTGLPARDSRGGAREGGDGEVHAEDGAAPVVRAVREIEATGSAVEIRVLDPGDAAAVAALCDELAARPGGIAGVVHCAGATGPAHFRPVASVTPALWREHFRPKVDGVLALARALERRAPDFVVLMSSISTVLGGLGFLPYASANAFMDAFAESRLDAGTARWISIGWDGWVLGDEALEGEAANVPGGLAVDEGLRALAFVLASRPGAHVVVAAGELAPRIREWVDLAGVREGDARGDDAPQPVARAGSAATRLAGDVEQHVAGLWEQLLGVTAVAGDDNFFELGGHSLLAIQLAARLRERYRIEFAVDTVFAAPTVNLLAREVRHRQAAGGASGDADLEALIAEVEAMDEAALDALLAADAPASGATGEPIDE